MLLERAAGLAARIEQYNQLKGTAEEAAHFETRATQFSTVADELHQTRESLHELRIAGVPISFAPSEGAKLTERTRALRSAIKTDPNVLSDPPFDLKFDFTNPLHLIHENAERAMLQAWQDFIRGVSDGHSEEILTALASIPPFRPIVIRMRQGQVEINALASNLPSDAKAAVAKLNALVVAHRAAWEEMTADGIPQAVIRFLKACAAEGAPLSGLTEEVRVWLNARNLLGAFRIRI